MQYNGESGDYLSPEERRKIESDKKAKRTFQKGNSKRKKKGKKTHRKK